jgi:hypothetical protein
MLDSVSPRRFWPLRATLQSVTSFGGQTVEDLGQPWWGWYRWIPERYEVRFSIPYSEIATHNHFLLDRGGNVFNQTAPVIKLPAEATEDQHLELLGLLNSSTACFWLKQICFPKGGDTVGQEGARVRKHLWDIYYAFDGTKLKQLPIPEEKPLALTKEIQREADARAALLPEKLCAAQVPTRSQLDQARGRAAEHLAKMIALQEELDWECYRLYGIVEEDLTVPLDEIQPLQLGERAFEILMARLMRSGVMETTWFERHHSSPITEPPSHWPQAYTEMYFRRHEVMQSNRDIALIERPEYKRRWNLPTWEEMESAALKNWLLARIELNTIWKAQTLVSCAQLRDALAQDSAWVSIAELYLGAPVEDLDRFVIDLATPEAVPFLPVLRYTETGLRKRADWEDVWKLQREEDDGGKVEILPPPKYRSSDFQSDYWRLRGGLDVPKERFILYPEFRRDSDETPVLGWAGWSDLEQARALAAYYQRMRTEEGWEPKRLKPILAGLLDLREWLKQWHDDVDPETGLKLGTYFSEFAEAQCQELGFSTQEVLAWQPPAGTQSSRKKKSKAQ